MLEMCFAIIGAAAGLISIWEAVRQYVRYRQDSAVDNLYYALQRRTVTSKIELRHQIRYYVPQRFLDQDGRGTSMRQLKKQVLEQNQHIVLITGKPAVGKTTAVRYLYCQLYKKRTCLYFQFKNITKDEELEEYVREQAAVLSQNKDRNVIAFFDGADEALSYMNEDTFRQWFLYGENGEPKIYQLFRDQKLSLQQMIFGIRKEFFHLQEDGHLSNIFQWENLKGRVYELQPFEKKEAVRAYRSLRHLKRMERKLKNDEKRHQQHYPEWKEAGKYLRTFREILEYDPDSIFYYPMYIRYAYPYMKEYYNKGYVSRLSDTQSGAALAKEVIIQAILKWELHVYNIHQGKTCSASEKERFYTQMSACLTDIVGSMISHGCLYIEKNILDEKLSKYHLSGAGTVALTHSLMVSGKNAGRFEFCHMIFYECFAARFLLDMADAEERKKLLLSGNSGDIRRLYQEYLTQDLRYRRLWNPIRTSVHTFQECSDSLITEYLQNIQDKEVIRFADDPVWTMDQVYEYLPFIHAFSFQNMEFTPEMIQEMKQSRIMDLGRCPWKNLGYSSVLMPLQEIERLSLCGMRLTDIGALKEFTHLKEIDLRLAADSGQGVVPAALELLKAHSQECRMRRLWIRDTDGDIIKKINEAITQGTLLIEEVLVEAAPYGKAYVALYRLQKESRKQPDGKRRLYLANRSQLDLAIGQFKKAPNGNQEVCEAVFRLETEADTRLMAEVDDISATLWNGLALLRYYHKEDYTDEDNRAHELGEWLKTQIRQEEDTSLRFCLDYCYGIVCNSRKEYKEARTRLSYAYQNAEHYAGYEIDRVDAGLSLYKSMLRLKEDCSEIAEKLKKEICSLSKYRNSEKYLRYLKYSNVRMLQSWKKGEPCTREMEEQSEAYLSTVKEYKDIYQSVGQQELFTGYYMAVIFANRSERSDRAEQILDSMEQMIPKVIADCKTRNQQASYIELMEQKIYHYFLTGDYGKTIQLIDELKSVQFRRKDLSVAQYDKIRNMCVNGGAEGLEKHVLWESFWY